MALINYEWPQNVRELSHCLTSAELLKTDAALALADLPEAVRLSAPVAIPRTSVPPACPTALSPEEQALRDDLERRLHANSGNVTAVARELGKARQQVYRWMHRLGLVRQSEPEAESHDRE